ESVKLQYLPKAIPHLRSHKPMHGIIKRIGDFQPKPVAPHDYFRILTFSIVSQMLSLKAAATIQQRLVTRLKPRKVVPAAMLALNHDDLLGVGLSNTKARA